MLHRACDGPSSVTPVCVVGAFFVVVVPAVLVLVPLDAALAQLATTDGLEKHFANVTDRVSTISVWIRNILFLVAGIALIACAASAYAGRFNIKWFVTVLVSVILIAVNGALTSYFVKVESGTSTTSPFMDDALQDPSGGGTLPFPYPGPT